MLFHYKLMGRVSDMVDNQLRDNNPPETKYTMDRLMAIGYNNVESKKLICKCLMLEMIDAMKNNKVLNEERYIKNLLRLPEEPAN